MTDSTLPEIKSLWDFDNPALSEKRFRQTLAEAAARRSFLYIATQNTARPLAGAAS